MSEWINVAQLCVSFALVGLIWTIQLVHYPAFRYVGEANFVRFEAMHTKGITLIVAPCMLVELALSIYAFHESHLGIYEGMMLLLILGIWWSTILFSVPCHKKLSLGKDNQVIEKLIQTNWIRTGLWSAKALGVVSYQVWF